MNAQRFLVIKCDFNGTLTASFSDKTDKKESKDEVHSQYNAKCFAVKIDIHICDTTQNSKIVELKSEGGHLSAVAQVDRLIRNSQACESSRERVFTKDFSHGLLPISFTVNVVD